MGDGNDVLAGLVDGLRAAAAEVMLDLEVLSLGGGVLVVDLTTKETSLDDAGRHSFEHVGRHDVGGHDATLVLVDGALVVSADPELMIKAVRPPTI